MRDDYESAAWAENHRHLSAAVHGLINSFAYIYHAFERLQAIEYYEPWRGPRR